MIKFFESAMKKKYLKSDEKALIEVIRKFEFYDFIKKAESDEFI